jgi:hypothetical protein
MGAKERVWVSCDTEKLCCADAAAYGPLAATEAVMVHVPGAKNAAVLPDVVQIEGVNEEKPTAAPELAEALSVS